MIWLEGARKQVSHGGGCTKHKNNKPDHGEAHSSCGCCCGPKKEASSNTVFTEKSANGLYFMTSHKGGSEVISLADKLPSSVSAGMKKVKEVSTLSLQSKVTLTAFLAFLSFWALASFGFATSGVVLVINQLVLAVIIAPYFYRLSRFSKGCLLTILGSVGLFFVMPVLFPVVVLSFAFDSLVRGQFPSWGRASVICLFQYAVYGLASFVSPWFWLLAPLSGIRSMLQSSNLEVGCDFALTLVVLLAMVSSAVATLVGVCGVCLHDAVLAAMMVYAKDSSIHQKTKSQTFAYHAQGNQSKLSQSIKVLDQKQNTTISLDQLNPKELYDSGILLKMPKGNDFGHEVAYSVACFKDGILPPGSIIRSGAIIGQVIHNQLQSQKGKQHAILRSELDKLQMYLVPSLMVLSCLSVVSAGLVSGSISIAALVGMQALLAACPCIFMVIPYLESRLAHRFTKLNAGVSFNFCSKILTALRWPWKIESFEHGFDRTMTTHFPAPRQGGGAFVANENAMAYIRHLVERGKEKGLFFISGSAGRFFEAYISDLRRAGVTNPCISTGGQYTEPHQKNKAYQEVSNNDSRATVWYCDGNNDVDVAAGKVLSVGIDPVAQLKDKVTLTMMKWPKAKKAYEAIHCALQGQKAASILLIQAIAILVAAVLFPAIYLFTTGTLAPMYASCSIMLGGLTALMLEVELFNLAIGSPEINRGQEVAVKTLEKPSPDSSFGDELRRCWEDVLGAP